MEKFEILGKDLVYHGTIIDFYKLKLRTPAGHEVSWDHIEHTKGLRRCFRSMTREKCLR